MRLYVQAVVFVAVCVFPAVASAGATEKLDSVHVIEFLYKVISATSDRFNLRAVI